MRGDFSYYFSAREPTAFRRWRVDSEVICMNLWLREYGLSILYVIVGAACLAGIWYLLLYVCDAL